MQNDSQHIQGIDADKDDGEKYDKKCRQDDKKFKMYELIKYDRKR